MDTCRRCDWKYPSGLVQPMMTGSGYQHVCGICALEIKNAVHGTKDKRFHGEMAEDVRRRCVSYRAKHPEFKPQEVIG